MNIVAALFQGQLSDNEVAEVLGELERSGVIRIREGKVSYELSDRA